MKYLSSITSISNPKIKALIKLSNKDNCFLVYSENVIFECMKYNYQILEVYVLDKFINKVNQKIFQYSENNYVINKNIIDKLFNNGNIYIVAKIKKQTNSVKINNNAKLVVLLDNVQNPDNMGSIIRTSLGLGCDYVICYNSVNKYNYKLICASTGLCLSNKVIFCNDLDYIKSLKNNFIFITTNLSNNNLDVKTVKQKYKYKNKVIVFGNEGHGISNDLLSLSNDNMIIKMKNNVDSLNIAISVAIIIYELTIN